MNKLLAIFIVLGSINYCFAYERIDITSGNVDPMPIANPNFAGDTAFVAEMGKEIATVINNDLQSSGLFKIIDSSAYIEQIKNTKQTPNFSAWRQINASALLGGEIISVSRGVINVEYKLWDPYGEKVIKVNGYQAKESDWRRIAHKIADDVYQSLTGEEGYFNTKIIFIAESGPAKKRIKRLAIVDQDGANLKYLNDNSSLNLTPRFSPDNHKALYLSFAKNKPRVHIRDLNSNRDQILGHFSGMTFAPRFAPNGQEVALSAAINGSSDIYLMNLASKQSKKITSGAYINTSPYFSPDGNKIAFISDRSGTAQIYTMNKDGSDQKRISFGQGRYYTPTWSPRGDFIAFTRLYNGKFYIGVMRPDGSGERMLTSGYLVDSPAWSPNGRVILYTRVQPYLGGGKAAKSNLFMIDITGHFDRSLNIAGDSSDASWSNPLN